MISERFTGPFLSSKAGRVTCAAKKKYLPSGETDDDMAFDPGMFISVPRGTGPDQPPFPSPENIK